jgi:3-deoxy-D-manno-octulosonate 8-phosphate phosphatase (KDO 8-P phosphatase)
MYDVLITDVDGVLTDGKFLYSTEGKVYKEFGPHDADAIGFFKQIGVEVIAISADKRGFPITKKRLTDMGVPIYCVSENERLSWIKNYCKGRKYGFVGDGYFDIPALLEAEVAYCPFNAIKQAKQHAADVLLEKSGGNGVLLEVFEHFIKHYSEEKYESFMRGEFKKNA